MNTQTYTVNIRTGVVNITRVDVSQGDTGRTLAFSLYDGLIPFTPPSGSTVTIVGRKPSGLGFSETCTVSGNTAAVNTTLAMTQEAGKFPVELRIEANGESIGTANFTMYIEPSPHPDGTTDGTHATVDNLQTQIGNLSELATSEKSSLVGAINEAAQSGGSEITVDDTLTTAGAAADAKKTGDEISGIKADLDALDERVEALEDGGNGLTESIKNALMDVVSHIGAWTDGNAQDYIDDLYTALYPPATLVSISCDYMQSGAVYTTDTLDSLKTGLTVTGIFDDNTTVSIPAENCTLSGTLSEGTSTITVTYSGKTSTFNVTVSVGYSVTNNLTNCSNTNTETKVAKGTTYSGIIDVDSGYELDTVSITMSGSDITSTAYSNGIITVANVTGDIVINAVAITTPVYTSSNGYEYAKRFTINPDSTLQNFLSKYGTMEELEELTIIGTIKIISAAGSVNGNNSLDVGTYCPNIKKLVIAPTRIRYNTDLNTLKFGHYAFTGIPASLTYIQLGSVNDSVYFTNSGYFRNDGTSAGLGGDTRIGNTNGLELVVYTDSYKANGGFTGKTEITTVVKEYLYTDGSVLTA